MNSSEKVVHYHGTPIWGNKGEVCKVAVSGTGAFVSYARPDQIKLCLKHATSVGIDNAAFSAWKRGLKIDWYNQFYPWLMKHYFNDKVTMFMIPDIIDGTEEENNALIKSVPQMFRKKATPVWHLHESLDKLNWLCGDYPRIAFGSSGQYATIRSKAWFARMDQAFDLIIRNNHTNTKIHGLRMLDGRVLGNYPLTTADSTNLACNIPKYKAKYPDIGKHILNRAKPLMCFKPELNKKLLDKEDKYELLIHRCAVLKGAVEGVYPPTFNDWVKCKTK